MNNKVEKQQKYLSPLTLRLIQLLFNVVKSKPVITPKQKDDFQPFFIIGSGRCGSTLLRSILLQHKSLHIPPESAALPSIIKKYYRYNGSDWKDLVNIILGEFSSFGAYKYWQIDVFELREKLYATPKKEQSLAFIIMEIYNMHMNKFSEGAKIWGDKTTFNTLRLEWIHRLFPNAKYINLIRDGRDVASSYLKSGLIDNLEQIAWRWNTATIKAETFAKSKKSKSSFLNVHYEDLVTKPEETSKAIFNFLNLDFSGINENRETSKMGDTVLEHHANVKNPINSESIGKWKKDLSNEDQLKASNLMKSQLKKLNYLP
jgi:hypothetical protein